jgi:predicted transcriptional regulator YdeE
MIFKGIEIRFNCKNNEQYENIGLFWDYMRKAYPGIQLRGLGYSWADDSLGYVIGDYEHSIQFDIEEIKKQYPSALYVEINLPDNGWQIFSCHINGLGQLYEQIYKDGVLDYEIEEIHSDGNCKISILRLS